MTHRELLERIAAANSGIAAVTAIQEFENEIIERCYLAARGTSDSAFMRMRRQLYWKGRADAATAVRELKHRGDTQVTQN